MAPWGMVFEPFGLKTGMESRERFLKKDTRKLCTVWYQIWSGFGELSRTPPPPPPFGREQKGPSWRRSGWGIKD